MNNLREPKRHTVIRLLSQAITEARKGRAPIAIIRQISDAMHAIAASGWKGRKS